MDILFDHGHFSNDDFFLLNNKKRGRRTLTIKMNEKEPKKGTDENIPE